MGEYVTYGRREVKIGTLENLYYVSFDKFQEAYVNDRIFKADGSCYPSDYLQADSDNRFRFPFPDEDRLPFGSIIEPPLRGVAVKIVGGNLDGDTFPAGTNAAIYKINIVQQRLVHRQADGKLCLALVYQNPKTEKLFRVEDDKEVRFIAKQIIRHHVQDEPSVEKRAFYREVARRMMRGYRLELHPQIAALIKTPQPRQRPPKPDKPGQRLP